MVQRLTGSYAMLDAERRSSVRDAEFLEEALIERSLAWWVQCIDDELRRRSARRLGLFGELRIRVLEGSTSGDLDVRSATRRLPSTAGGPDSEGLELG